jgi:hypothetical protein
MLRRVAISVLAASLASLGSVATGTAASSPIFRKLQLNVSNLPAGQLLQMVYDDGVDHSDGGTAVVQSGTIQLVNLQANLVSLMASEGPLTATVSSALWVDAKAVSGTATIPAGATVTASFGGAPVAVNNGSFSIPTGISGAKPPNGPLTVRCQTDGSACRAIVPLAGGASDRLLDVKLPGTTLRLGSISVAPRSSRGAYSLTRGHYRAGGREWLATLNAVRANPRGAHLTLTFGPVQGWLHADRPEELLR